MSHKGGTAVAGSPITDIIISISNMNSKRKVFSVMTPGRSLTPGKFVRKRWTSEENKMF